MPGLPKLPRLPDSPAIDFGKRLLTQTMDDEVFDRAAGLAYRFLFALFPFAIFLAALAAYLAGWLGLGDPTKDMMGAVGDNLPPGIAAQLLPQFQAVLGETRPGLLTIGALGALWAATGGIGALQRRSTRPTTCPRPATSSPRPARRSASRCSAARGSWSRS